MCCTQLAGNTGRRNDAKSRHLGTITHLCWAVSSQLRRISTIRKNLLNCNTSSRCRNTVKQPTNGRVWGTPTNFNGFRVLAALLHGTLVVGVSQTFWVEQRAPPMFGRAAITLGISPHSSSLFFFFPRPFSAVADWI